MKGDQVTESTAGVRSYALLADGATIEIRPARPADFAQVLPLHEEMSPDNLYLRFFSLSQRAARAGGAPGLPGRPGLTTRALLALLDDELVGVASYEPTGQPGTAEVAFAVADRMHGRGVATLLLEHLVSLARAQRRDALHRRHAAGEHRHAARVRRRRAERPRARLADGVVELTMPIPRGVGLGEPSRYLDAVAGREQRADVASLAPLFAPGPSR